MNNICLKQGKGRRALWQTSTKASLEFPSLELREFNCDLSTSLSPAIFTRCYLPSKCLLTGVNLSRMV